MERLERVSRQLRPTPAPTAAVEDYSGRVVLVTGAGGGIGSRIAVSFASAGAGVALCDVRADELEATAAECRGLGAAVHAAVVDVGEEGEVREFCAAAAAALGGVDALVNTVGIVVSWQSPQPRPRPQACG